MDPIGSIFLIFTPIYFGIHDPIWKFDYYAAHIFQLDWWKTHQWSMNCSMLWGLRWLGRCQCWRFHWWLLWTYLGTLCFESRCWSDLDVPKLVMFFSFGKRGSHLKMTLYSSNLLQVGETIWRFSFSTMTVFVMLYYFIFFSGILIICDYYLCLLFMITICYDHLFYIFIIIDSYYHSLLFLF